MIKFLNVEAALKVIAAVKTAEEAFTVTKPVATAGQYALAFNGVTIAVESKDKLVLGTVVSVDDAGVITVVSVPETAARKHGCAGKPVEGY